MMHFILMCNLKPLVKERVRGGGGDRETEKERETDRDSERERQTDRETDT